MGGSNYAEQNENGQASDSPGPDTADETTVVTPAVAETAPAADGEVANPSQDGK